MAKYIEGYSAAQLPPPYGFEEVRIWSFPLLADLGTVQAMVDRYLGPVQEGDEVFTLLPGAAASQSGLTIVYMMVLDYARMRCLGPGGGPQGFLSQREFLFGIVVKRSRPDPARASGLFEDLAFFTPTIFVDNAWSAICGNTVLGYPKLPAWFQLPRAGFYPIQIETQVFVDNDPDTGQSLQLLAEIRNAFSLLPGASSLNNMFPFGDLEKLYGPNGAFPLHSGILDLFRTHNRQMSYDIIQLKQFRNAETPEEASYSALVTCRVQVSKMNGFGLLPPAVVDLKSYASLDIPAALGLQSVGGLYMPLSPYWVECDFALPKSVERPLSGSGASPRAATKAAARPRRKRA